MYGSLNCDYFHLCFSLAERSLDKETRLLYLYVKLSGNVSRSCPICPVLKYFLTTSSNLPARSHLDWSWALGCMWLKWPSQPWSRYERGYPSGCWFYSQCFRGHRAMPSGWLRVVSKPNHHPWIHTWRFHMCCPADFHFSLPELFSVPPSLMENEAGFL